MEYQRELLVAKGIDEQTLPDDLDGMPETIASIYTASPPEGLNQFDTIRLTAEGTDLDVKLVVVGVVEGSPSLLYVIDPHSGEVLQYDTAKAAVRGVNSSYRRFVEFLSRIAFAMEMSGNEHVEGVLNRGMRFTLRGIDERAFEASAWWPTVFARLGLD